jgi:hypothetical protein
MTPAQLTRLEQLDSIEFKTPAEDTEHAYLLRLESDMRQVFELLQAEGFRPTWVGGEYIIANVPGIRSLPGSKTEPFTEPEVVRSATGARRLIAACA